MARICAERKLAGFRLGNGAACGSLGTVLKKLRRRNLSGWLCLLGSALHLLAPFCPAAWRLPNAITVTNAAGQTVTNTYDLHNRLTQSVDAAGIQNTFVYDAGGNKTAISDGLGQTTTFEYDLLNRLTRQTFANGDSFTYTYDALHKLSHTDVRGAVTTFEYDQRDNQTTTAFYAPGGTVPAWVRSMSYDAAKRLLSVTETNRPEATVAYTYDAQNRILSETSSGVTHQHEYDLAGNRVKTTFGTGRVVQTSYDGLNRPETLVEGGRVTRYGYDLAGRAVILVAANGQVTNNTYDELGRVVDRTLFRTAAMTEADVVAEFGWAYDALGNVVAQHEVWPGAAGRSAQVRATTMTYDGANRLMTETIADPVAGNTATSYAYDMANNRTAKTVTGGSEAGRWTYTHNEANQLVSWTKRDVAGTTELKSATLTYDGNGNRASQTVTGTPDAGNDMQPPNAAIGTTTYTWDLSNRLMGVTLPNGNSYGYQYDYRGRRVSIVEGGSIGSPKYTAVSFSGGLSVAEWEAPVGGSLGPVATVEYQRGPDMGGGIGGLLYSNRGSTDIRHNLFNARGDVVAQSNSAASVTWTASYEAFGRRTVETGDNDDKQRANTKDEDPTGLLNEGFRYRDLETGVFLSRDPAGFVDGPNVYTYVQQNPWTKNDPEGLFWHIAAAALIGAAISVASQAVCDVAAGKMSDLSTYAGAAAGGATTGAVLAATGNPTLAGAAGGAAQSATEQYASTGTVDGGQVMKDAAVGMAGGKMGAMASKALGCATNKVVKAAAGAAADGLSGAGTQVVENVLNGDPPMQGALEAGLGNLPGAGIVAGVMQRESCFLAGTSVTLGTGDRAMIESLRVGQRVSTPESVGLEGGPLTPVSGTLGSDGSETAVDPATWRSYSVRLLDARTGWDIFDITLLRPQGWMAEHSRQIAGRSEVWVDFEELHARGWAQVIEERACPPIAEGSGRVITATITHSNDDVRTLTLDGGETLFVTGNHRMFSATANDWVPVQDLEIGEELQTSRGRESVASLGYQRGRHQVYNLEVEAEHCYFVGSREVLTHNGCDVTDSAYKGGSHDEMSSGPGTKGDGLESHHMPDKRADPFARVGEGPAIQMDPHDHQETSSHGWNGNEGKEYRKETARMITNGDYRKAMAREIKDVRSAAQRGSGDRTKYNGAVKQMLSYARKSGQLPDRKRRR
jgi:RHS repeat-associated protein